MNRGFRNVLYAAVLLGLCLRVYCFAVRPPTLWQDEAYWAVKTLTTKAIDAQIRPLGFMLVTQFLLRVFGAAAWVYRALPFLGSLVSMSLSAYVVTRLFKQQWSQLLAVLLLAVSPVALEMAVEFKHYGTEIGVYIGVLAAWLHLRERGTWRALALLLGVAWFCFFFSITVIFLYPALFGGLAWHAYRDKSWRRFALIAGIATVCLGTITTTYFTTWRGISANKAEQKWGTWYDVFYIQNGLRTTHDSRLAWTTAKYFGLAASPGIDRELWRTERVSEERLDGLKLADTVLWGALHVAGLAYLMRRRRFEELALLWSPLLVVTAFNLAGRWPAGAFRTNTFYLPFAILLSCFAVEWLPEQDLARRRLAMALCGVLWLSTVVFRPSITVKGLWTKPGAMTEALALLPTGTAKDSRTLLMDFETCRPWDYYTEYDRPFAERGQKLHRAYRKNCQRSAKQLQSALAHWRDSNSRRITILLTDPRKFSFMERAAKRYCGRTTSTDVHHGTHYLITCERN